MQSGGVDADGEDSTPPAGIDRRSVLKGLGAGAILGVGATGQASATTETEGPPVFCGCSQVCACGTGDADVLFAAEEAGRTYAFTWYRDVDFDFCVSTDDAGVPDGKIVALQVAGTRWVNPNQCAEKALAAMHEQMHFTHPTPEGEAGGPCGQPPCSHPGRGKGRGGGDDAGPPADTGRGGGRGR